MQYFKLFKTLNICEHFGSGIYFITFDMLVFNGTQEDTIEHRRMIDSLVSK